MDPLRFAHQFFYFSRAEWLAHWQGATPSWEGVKQLFRSDHFSRRQLRYGPIQSLGEAEQIFAETTARETAAGVRALMETDPLYPTSILRYVPPHKRPVLLYICGADVAEENKMIALVGTRSPSTFGQNNALQFASYLSALHIRIVSGLAKGIDTIAHKENLSQGTVAVLGSGLLDPYPQENADLAQEILRRGGTLLSPFPLAQVPLPQNFPIRNELIAALACGTIVVEGCEKSGAAITGKLALAMDKTVVTLSQDFRTNFGRGALRLQQAGALFVANEEEALQAIYARLGGFATPSLPTDRTFSLADFHKACGGELSQSLVLLQEGLLHGQIEKRGVDRFRLTKTPDDAKR